MSPTEATGKRPPSVETLLRAAAPRIDDRADHEAIVALAREVIAAERARLGEGLPAAPVEALAASLVERLEELSGSRGSGLVSVINGTGVIVHTNLGRAAWPTAAVTAAVEAAGGPVLLELDRGSGRRGHRFRAAEEHLIALTGAEDALITNNNAAALALAVGLARRRSVAVSRGELIEIGGGVRIPEIVKRAGARLLEVGTTNRTRAADYESAVADGASMLLSVHRSNFRQDGFVESVSAADLGRLGASAGVPFVDDLGSGALIDTAHYGLEHEPMPAERLAAGADLVTFSGDKLVGGPQAGLIVGRADLIKRIRRDPLARAMRPDKTTLAAISATLALYRAGRATLDIPVWRAISASVEDLRARAETVAAALPVEIVETEATVGGGSLPGETLPSVGLRITGEGASQLVADLRRSDPAVIARIEHGSVIVDLRTVMPDQDEALRRALGATLRSERVARP